MAISKKNDSDISVLENVTVCIKGYEHQYRSSTDHYPQQPPHVRQPDSGTVNHGTLKVINSETGTFESFPLTIKVKEKDPIDHEYFIFKLNKALAKHVNEEKAAKKDIRLEGVPHISYLQGVGGRMMVMGVPVSTLREDSKCPHEITFHFIVEERDRNAVSKITTFYIQREVRDINHPTFLEKLAQEASRIERRLISAIGFYQGNPVIAITSNSLAANGYVVSLPFDNPYIGSILPV